MDKKKKGMALKAFLPKGWRIVVDECGENPGSITVHEAAEDSVVRFVEPDPEGADAGEKPGRIFRRRIMFGPGEGFVASARPKRATEGEAENGD